MPCTLADAGLQWPCRVQAPAGRISVAQLRTGWSGAGQQAMPTSMG